MTASLVIAVLLVVPAFFGWSAIHESSHYLAVRSQRKLLRVSFKIYPHRDETAGFRWASVQWWYADQEPLTPHESALVHLAPRAADALAAILLPIGAALLPLEGIPIWLVLVGAGLVDLGVGSVGQSPHSDLRRASQALDISPWWLRVGGYTVLAASVAATLGVILTRVL